MKVHNREREYWPNIIHLPCMDINYDNLRLKVSSLCSNIQEKAIQPIPSSLLISPKIVNCSARIGLDLLTKHYVEAVGFELVFFLPNSEDDSASYTEFLCYLGSNDRAGITKLNDGTTLFLVPPSDFLSKVLKVSGLERLYGVVLKLAQQVPSGASMQQQSHRPIPFSQYCDRQQIPPHVEYSLILQKERVLHMDHNSSILHED